MQHIKCVVVGSGAVGKTCLIYTYTTGAFPGEYIPSCGMDTPSANVMFDNKPFQITMWDTAGQSDYDRLRPLSYPGTNIFLLCFAINSRDSFEELQTKFYCEIKFHCPGVPFIVVGTKSDLRTNGEYKKYIKERNIDCNHFVSYEEGEILCDELYGYKYIECSSLQQINLKYLFEAAIRVTCFVYIVSDPSLLLKKNRKNREYFNKYNVYDLHTLIFMILCSVIDLLLTIIHIITIIHLYYNGLLELYHFYNVFIFCPVAIMSVFKYCYYGFTTKYSVNTKYMSPYCRIRWIMQFLLILFVLIPFILFCATFSIFSYLFYHFVNIKFPFHANYIWINLYMDLFTMLRNTKYDITVKTIVNNELSKKGIIEKKINMQLNEILTENKLSSMIIDRQSKDSTFIKYLWFNVYNTLLVFDYVKYHKQSDTKQNRFCAVFYYLLFPIFIFSQFSRIIFCIYYHKYHHIVLDVLFILFIFIIITLFVGYVLEFHWNIWQIGYNQKLKYIEQYTLPMHAFEGIHHEYQYHRIQIVKKMLISLVGLDIANIVCNYLRFDRLYIKY